MDGIDFKVREKSKVIYKTIYIAVGLGLGKNEFASFWMSVLTHIISRGTEDIRITANHNLNGFTDTIRVPESKTQSVWYIKYATLAGT
jgi:transposase-like protein